MKEKLCQICGTTFYKKVHESKKYWFRKKLCSRKCADSINLWKPGRLAWNKGKKVPQIKGLRNGNWKGGTTSENELLRKSNLYKLWRKAVYQKDNYTCQKCGYREGKLNAHHIKPFAMFPELRFAIDNGETLCIPCHHKVNHLELFSAGV